MSNRATSQTKLYKQCEQFVLHAYRSLEEEPQKLKAFITLFHRAKKPDAKILESQMKLVNIIQDFPDLVRQLNLLVPEEFKVPELDLEDAGQQEGDDQIDINAIFTELHKKRPEKVKELITLLQSLKNKQSSLSVQALRESVYKILEEEPKLLNAFMRCVEPLLNESANGAEEEHEQDKPAKGEQKPGRGNKRPNILMPTVPRASNPRDRRRDPEVAQPSKDTPADSTWPSTLRYEMYLFEYLEKNLSEEAYTELAKIIFLYTECIISAVEVFQMSKPLFEGNDNYFNFFQEIIHIREPMRRKNTILFKPLNEVDFKKMNCERVRSYTKLPENFSYLKNPFNPKNALSSTILNKEWVSVPQGSEVNFKVNTRNTYEVNLFLGEDERYEFDVAIYNYKTAMKWLQGLETARTDEEKAHLVERLLKLKVIQKVYGNNNEIIDLFKKNPAGVAKVFIDRIQIKLAELNDTKWNQAKRKWVEVAAQNFHRALDHRSFYFKQSEKKLTSHKNFTAEAQIRHTEVNIKNNMQKAIKYLDTLDTFEGLSNGQSCNHPQVDGFAQDLLKKNSRPRKVLPVYRMLWTDKKIIQDIVDIINLRIQTFHATLNEKDKILRYFKIFMTELINMPYKAENTYDVIPDQTMVSNLVTEIESKIFTKIFHFNVGKIMNDANKESPENGAPAANNKMSVEEKKEKEGGKPKKSEMEVEKAGGKGKVTSGDKMEDEPPKPKDDGESLEDDLRLDSGDEEQSNIKEMEYEKPNGADTIFLPTAGPGEKVFYSTQHIYCLIRFYFTLYERFVKARETAQEFEINEKTILLPHAEKDVLAEERYNVFKWVLVHLLRSNIDNEKYEDLLRSIFGNKAYLMFYIDRIVHSMILTIQKIIADDITLRTLNLFTESDILTKTADPNKTKVNASKNKNWPEHVYLAQLNQLTFKYMNNLQNTSFFRFLYNPETQVILVSMHDSPYKDWKDKTLEPVIPYSKAYLSSATIKDTYLKTSRNPVYLMRNKELNRKKSVANQVKIIQENDIEWKYLPNTLKQVTDKVEQEEYLFVVRKKEAPEEELRKKVCSQLQKATRFQLWYKKLTKS